MRSSRPPLCWWAPVMGSATSSTSRTIWPRCSPSLAACPRSSSIERTRAWPGWRCPSTRQRYQHLWWKRRKPPEACFKHTPGNEQKNKRIYEHHMLHCWLHDSNNTVLDFDVLRQEQAMLIACPLNSLLIPHPATPHSPWCCWWSGPKPATLPVSYLATTSCL